MKLHPVPANHMKIWTPEQVDVLLMGWAAGNSITALALCLQRYETAIQCRLEDLLGESYTSYRGVAIKDWPRPRRCKHPATTQAAMDRLGAVVAKIKNRSSLENIKGQLLCAQNELTAMRERHETEMQAVLRKIEALEAKVADPQLNTEAYYG